MASLSRLLDGFRPSAIGEIFSLTIRLKEEGRDIVDLSIGEPDFDTPDHVKDAAVRAIRDGDTKYTSVDGTTALKRAVATKFARDNGLEFGLDQILVGCGVKPLLFHAMQAVLEPGDEVLLPVPAWASYTGMARLLGAQPVLVPCAEEAGFKLAPEHLERAITPATRLLLLNSPGNPTGAAYDAGRLKALTDVLVRHPRIWVFSDDIYEAILFDGLEFATAAQVEPRLADRALTFNGVSKGYAMTGWRIGYVGGPKEAIDGIRKIMSQSTGNPPTASQVGAVAALEGPQDFLAERAAAFARRRDLIVEAVNAIPGLRCPRPEGAFYVYVNCAAHIGRTAPDGTEIASSADFARYLLSSAGLAVVPGAAFEMDPYVRISYAASTEVLNEAVDRLDAACRALGGEA
jgi:aspartate aminotransferase